MGKEGSYRLLSEHKILRFNHSKSEFKPMRDLIAVEDAVSLYINNDLYAVFHCSPLQIRELVIGYLLTEGIIGKIEEILKIEISGKKIYVQVAEENVLENNGRLKCVSTICSGGINKLSPKILKSAQKIKFNKIKFDIEVIFKAVKILNSKAHIFRVSGGTHAAALLNEDCELIAFAEDIGRHNTVDKVIGEALMKKVDLSRVLLASTGRLTSEIVVKALQAGIPILVSLSAPTDKGVKLSEMFGLTLIGFARGKRFNVYASPARIDKAAIRH